MNESDKYRYIVGFSLNGLNSAYDPRDFTILKSLKRI